MYYRGFDRFGTYCSRWFGHDWSIWNFLIVALIVIAVVILAVVLIKASTKKKSSESDELLALLKAKYAAGELTEEEYLKKREVLRK